MSFLQDFRVHLVGLAALVSMVVGVSHVVLHKRDVRAAIGWAGLIVLAPLLGALLYYLFGINRITRKGTKLRSQQVKAAAPAAVEHVCRDGCLRETLGDERHMMSLVELAGRLTGQPLLEGNRVDPLIGGDEAYPAIIEAIDAAR